MDSENVASHLALRSAHVVPLINQLKRHIANLDSLIELLTESALDLIAAFLPVERVSEDEIQAFLAQSDNQLELSDRDTALQTVESKLLDLLSTKLFAMKDLEILQQLDTDMAQEPDLVFNLQAAFKNKRGLFLSEYPNNKNGSFSAVKVRKLKSMPEYKAYQRQKWEFLRPGETYDNSAEYVESEGDESIEIAGSSEMFTCPLTGRVLQDPMTCATCKHSFSKAAITQLFGRGIRTVECPVAGCNTMLRSSDLAPDLKLAKRIKRVMRLRKQTQMQEQTISI